MNPNSISHRLFAAALSPVAAPLPKGPVRREESKPALRSKGGKSSVAPPPPASDSDWAWSGWQHRTI